MLVDQELDFSKLNVVALSWSKWNERAEGTCRAGKLVQIARVLGTRPPLETQDTI